MVGAAAENAEEVVAAEVGNAVAEAGEALKAIFAVVRVAVAAEAGVCAGVVGVWG